LVKSKKKRKEKQPDFISLTQTIQKMKNIIIASTSTVHGSDYLELKNPMDIATRNLFIPYARPSGISHEEYTAKAASASPNQHK
jgi:hypothetical protein